MTYNRFPNGAVVEINGAAYWAHGYSAGRLAFVHQVTGDHFRCLQTDGSMGLPTDRHFEELLAGGDAVIRSGGLISLRGMDEVADWTQDQSVRRDRDAARRAVICRMLDDAGVAKGDAAIRNFLEDHWTAELVSEYGPCPCSRTIRYWYSKRGRPGFRHPRHMVRRNFAAGNSHADSVEGQLLWMKVLAGAKRGLAPKAIHSDLAAEIALINAGQHPSIDPSELPLKTASQRTVRRRFDILRSSLTLPSVIEQEAQKQDWLGAGKSLTADFVMQRVIIDHTEVDAHVICPKLEMVLGRPWLTIAIDVKSRAIVGHVITFFAPSNWTVGEILRRIVLPKRPPRALAERKRAFRSTPFPDAVRPS